MTANTFRSLLSVDAQHDPSCSSTDVQHIMAKKRGRKKGSAAGDSSAGNVAGQDERNNVKMQQPAKMATAVQDSKASLAEAKAFLARTTHTVDLNINPATVPIMLPSVANKRAGTVRIYTAGGNWNLPQPGPTHEIINSLLSDPYKIDETAHPTANGASIAEGLRMFVAYPNRVS